MKKLPKIIFLFFFFSVSAQQNDLDFREDQFFFSFSYPFFSNNPSDLIQNKFSYSYSLGFVRDFPINIKRTLALAVGLGFEKSVVYNNYKIYEYDIDYKPRTFDEGKKLRAFKDGSMIAKTILKSYF